jgi:hypothetical protein
LCEVAYIFRDIHFGATAEAYLSRVYSR